MSGVLATTILGLLTLIINYTNILMIFPRRFNKTWSVILPVLFVGAFYAILLYTDLMTVIFGGARGFVHLPMIYLLTKGRFFQRLFCIVMQMLNIGVLLAFSKLIAMLFMKQGSAGFWNLYIGIAFIALTAYVILTARFGKWFVSKLSITDYSSSWLVYSLGAMFLFAVFSITFATINELPAYILMVFSTFFSMIILCFAIINTHEKAKQRLNAEFAREVISSGREHYQKMDELHDTLRTLRHDYKYHLIAIDEYLSDDNKDELRRYLDGIKTQFSESELHSFCTNAVVNALLVSYAERCAKSHIAFTADINLPDTLSVPNYDLCIVVGNLMENAVEACRKQPCGRKIEVILKPLGQQLALRVKNSFDGRVNESDGRLKSMKKDGGFGLRSIEAVAERYDGELLLDWQGGVFSAYVTMRL